MKSVIIKQPGEVCISNVSKPEIKEGEALLKVLYCGVCGADLASYTGNQPFTTYPRVPGHEFSAEIISIPKNKENLKAGDIVTCNPYFNCNKCYSCKRGFVNCCTSNETMGVQRDGSFQEFITMPVERIIPGRGLNAKQLALIEPFSIGYHAVSRCKIKPTDKVLIVGAGPIGLFALISAKTKGAEVYISDVLDGRLAKAKEMGADGTINPLKEDIKVWNKKITGGNGFDVCIEACGLPDTFLTCIEQVTFAGSIVLIGNGKKETTFLHSIILKKELNIYGSRNSYTKDFEALIQLVLDGKLDVLKMVSATYSIENAGKAFQALEKNDGSLVKVLIQIADQPIQQVGGNVNEKE